MESGTLDSYDDYEFKRKIKCRVITNLKLFLLLLLLVMC